MTEHYFVIRSLPEIQSRNIFCEYVVWRLPLSIYPEERKHLINYLCTNATLSASGENCLNKFVNLFGYANHPTFDRIPRFQVVRGNQMINSILHQTFNFFNLLCLIYLKVCESRQLIYNT